MMLMIQLLFVMLLFDVFCLGQQNKKNIFWLVDKENSKKLC